MDVKRRVIIAWTGAAIGALALSGCVDFKGEPKGKQSSAKSVRISFKPCAAGTTGCPDIGDFENGDVRLLVGVRVPQGTSSPDSFTPRGTGVKFKRDGSYRGELNSKAPRPDGTTWLGYSSKVFDYSGSPPSAKVALKLGLPNDIGKTFRFRPVLGFFQTSENGDPVDCGPDPFAGEGTVCIDAPDAEDVEKSIKVPLD